jgi:hypothetical protein
VLVALVMGGGGLWWYGAGGFGGGGGDVVVAAATTTWWWRWWWPRPWRSGGGGPQRTVGGPASWLLTFFVVFKSLCRDLYCSRYTCAEGDPLGSWHRALCRPSSAECSVPRASSRHRLCREKRGLCREHLAFGRGCESGSVLSPWRGAWRSRAPLRLVSSSTFTSFLLFRALGSFRCGLFVWLVAGG